MSPSMASTLDTESATIGYLYTAFAMMIVYDHALCLRQEIELFWRTKFVWPTWIFLSNRYILLLYGVSCLLQVPLWTTPLGCETTIVIFYIANILLFVISAIFAALRVYAISKRNIAVALGALSVGLVPAALNLYTTVDQSYAFLGSGGLCARRRYYTLGTENILDIVICVCAVSADLVVITITWRRTYRLWREASRQGEPSPLISLVLRDGILYFVMMLILNILELVVMRAWVTEASANVAYTSYIFVPLSPMFVNHFLIGLRQLSYADSHSGLPDMESTRTTTYGSSLATMGGHIKFGLHFATPSVTREESTQGEWNDLERSTEDDIEMHIMTS